MHTRRRLLVSAAMLAGIQATMLWFGAVAINAAGGDPPRWPAWLEWLPIDPVPAALVSVTAAVFLAVVLAVRAVRRNYPATVTSVDAVEALSLAQQEALNQARQKALRVAERGEHTEAAQLLRDLCSRQLHAVGVFI